MIDLYTIGGFSEVGKNMSALRMGDDVIILDCGLFMPPIVEMVERETGMHEKNLRDIGAVPDDLILDRMGLRNKVRAIIASHAHLDHIGAIPFIANRYNADVIATPFSVEVLKTLIKEETKNPKEIEQKIRVLQPNSSCLVNKKIKIDFINVTHSTLQTVLMAVHTDKGVVLYANDFKFDNTPILGKRPNYAKLKEIAKEGVLALIVDSLYSGEERKTPSEKIARGLLEDVMLTTSNENACIIVTTFSSHLARLKSIVDFGKQLNRKIVFVGRSLRKYVEAANRLKLIPFYKDVAMLSYKNEIHGMLKKINKNRQEYLIVCTGHQGETGSVLDRLSKDALPFSFSQKDHVIFSSRTIPTPINLSNKKQLEERLKRKGVRIFDAVHVSGHGAREDLRDFIEMLSPQHIIPAHGDLPKLTALAELATELGYRLGKDCHIMQDLQKLQIG